MELEGRWGDSAGPFCSWPTCPLTAIMEHDRVRAHLAKRPNRCLLSLSPASLTPLTELLVPAWKLCSCPIFCTRLSASFAGQSAVSASAANRLGDRLPNTLGVFP